MNQKLKLTQDKKAYLQLDFLFASLIFFTFVFTVYAHSESRIDDLDSRYDALKIKGYARDVCYLLINTQGNPKNWEDESVPSPNFIGLYNSTLGSLEADKLSALTVSMYRSVLDNMGIGSFVRLEIKGVTSGNIYRAFGAPNSGSISKFEEYSCYSNYNNEIVKVTVGIWE